LFFLSLIVFLSCMVLLILTNIRKNWFDSNNLRGINNRLNFSFERSFSVILLAIVELSSTPTNSWPCFSIIDWPYIELTHIYHISNWNGRTMKLNSQTSRVFVQPILQQTKHSHSRHLLLCHCWRFLSLSQSNACSPFSIGNQFEAEKSYLESAKEHCNNVERNWKNIKKWGFIGKVEGFHFQCKCENRNIGDLCCIEKLNRKTDEIGISNSKALLSTKKVNDCQLIGTPKRISFR
jgi:hypothetical protein